MKAANEPKIELIMGEIRNGTPKADIFANNCDFLQCKIRTFDTLYKEASIRVQQAQQALEAARLDQLSTTAKNQLNEAILTEMELDAIVSQIASGNCTVEEWVKGEAIIRQVNPTEVLNAVDKLYKRKGSYAPIKQATTKTDGTDADNPLDLLIQKGGKITIQGE